MGKGEVKAINSDGTYDIKINKGALLAKVKSNMIKAVGEIIDNTIYLQYKNQTNFSIIGSLYILLINLLIWDQMMLSKK